MLHKTSVVDVWQASFHFSVRKFLLRSIVNIIAVCNQFAIIGLAK
jgi:hypothetical protein